MPSEDSTGLWDAWNSLVETPEPGKVIETAGGGRQRDIIWEIPVHSLIQTTDEHGTVQNK